MENFFFGSDYFPILRSIGDPLNIIAPDYRVLWENWNAGGTGGTGKFCYEIYQQKSKPCPDCPVRIVFDTGKSCVMEKCFSARNGSVIWREVRAFPVYDENHNLLYTIKIGHDITDKKLGIEKQKRYIESLEKTLENLTKQEQGVVFENSGFRNMLTGRELEVLHLMADGFTNTEIAGILSISHHTVKSHITHIFDKLGVNDRTQAAVCAARLRLI